ncbi:hypothetical protein ACQZ63_23650 [Agrobacterium sp. CG160-95]
MTNVYQFHPSAENSIEALAKDALLAVGKISLAKTKQPTPDWLLSRDITTIRDEDIVGDPTAWLPQDDGKMAFVFMWDKQDAFGLKEEDYEYLSKLARAILKVKWAKKSISSNFICNAFVEWACSRLREGNTDNFCSYFIRKCDTEIMEWKAIIPIQHLAIEERFAFGKANIIPLNDEFFDDLSRTLTEYSPTQIEETSALISKMRSTMKRCAGIEIVIKAEPGYTQEAALSLAGDAVGLLRFFSLATITSTRMSPTSLLSSLIVPQKHIILNSANGKFRYSTGIAMSEVDNWIISRANINDLQQYGLDEVAALLDADELNDFQRAVRSSLLAFSRATTFPEMADRLVFAFSAIEGLMLRNASESIQQNVGDRVAFLTQTDPSKRQRVVENFREAYRMRSQYIHHRLTELDVRELDEAFTNIRAAISSAVSNANFFKTKDDFLAAIERKKYGA